MQQPTRLISTPFAQEGDKTEIQNVTGEFDNSATYRHGFPPITMQSIRAGGKPPKGTDFNGVLFDITENISFLCKGGRYQYNAGLSTLIGGYPEGSNLLLDDNVTEVVSTIAGNQNNPNVDMTGWILKPVKVAANDVQVGDSTLDVFAESIKIYKDLAIPINSFEQYAVDGDWSLAFKQMFDYAKSIHPQNVIFVGQSNQDYLLKTKTAGEAVFNIPGNASIHGQGCKIKISDGFGDFKYLFLQPQGQGWESGDFWEIKDFELDYNTTNNLKTNSNASNQRTAFFLWNYRNGQSNVCNITAKDFLGVWFVTQGTNRSAVINSNKIYYTETESPNEDRTAIYTGSQFAEVFYNGIFGKNIHCHGGIEAHGSNQNISYNNIDGVRVAFHVFGDAGVGAENVKIPTENINFSFNTVTNCNQLLSFWVTRQSGLKGVSFTNNVANLDSRCGTDTPITGKSLTCFVANKLESDLESVLIARNQITRHLNPEDLTTTGRWLHFASGFSEAAKAYRDIKIKDNTFKNGIFELIRVEMGSNQVVGESGMFDWDVSGNEFINSFNYTGAENHSAFHFSSVQTYQNINLNNKITTSYKNLAMRGVLETTAFYVDPSTDGAANNIEFKCEIEFKDDGMIIPYLIRTHKALRCDFVINDYLKFIPASSLTQEGTTIEDKKHARKLICTDATQFNKIRFDVQTQTKSDAVPSGDYSEGSFVRSLRGGVNLGYSCRYTGVKQDYDWQALKSVNRGDYIKIGTRYYLAVNGGTLSDTQPNTTDTSNIVDGDVTLFYVGAGAVTFETIAKVKQAAATSDNSVSLAANATNEQIIAAINTLATQDNTLKARLRTANVIKSS